MLKYEKWSIFYGSDSCNTSAQNNNKNVQKSKNDLKEIPETNEVTQVLFQIIIPDRNDDPKTLLRNISMYVHNACKISHDV